MTESHCFPLLSLKALLDGWTLGWVVDYHSSAGSVAGDKVLSTSQRLVLHKEGEKERRRGMEGNMERRCGGEMEKAR